MTNGPWNVKGKLKIDDELLLLAKATGSHLHGKDNDTTPVRIFRLQIVTDDFEDAGDLLLHAEDAHTLQQERLFHGRPLQARRINTELVRSWISDCRSSHPLCESRSLRQDLDISMPEQSILIDVHRQCLVDASSGAIFAALSYKWGDSQQFLTTEAELAHLRQPSDLAHRPLPRTVRDAITLTRDIGLKYVWIDALCIIQDSDDHKAKQISRMHHIYGGAAVTIIAASSNDADDGLHGVRDRLRDIKDDISSVDGIRIMARNCYMDTTMNRSEYNKRAWTYQESCLSRRLLYVTSKGVVMHCCQGVRSEEIILEENACSDCDCSGHVRYFDSTQRNLWREFVTKQTSFTDGTTNRSCTCDFDERQRFVDGQLPYRIYQEIRAANVPIAQADFACKACLDFQREISSEFHTYRDLVRGYTRREMRFESDRIPAFAGIAGLLANTFGCKFLYGLPEKYFDMALLWRPRQNRVEPCRASGLENVPSWSWASHEIGAEYTGDTWMTSEVDWYYVDDDHSLQRMQSLKYSGNHAPMREDFQRPVTMDQLDSHGFSVTRDEPLSSIYGWCQVSDVCYIKDSRLYDETKQPFDADWNTVMYSNAPPTNGAEFVPVELCFISRSNHADLNPRVMKTRFRNGDWDLEEHKINVLIIETHKGVSKRIAKASIFNAAQWKRVKREWRLVKLV